jgi:hypothetical protein
MPMVGQRAEFQFDAAIGERRCAFARPSERARELNPKATPMVERVCNTTGGKPDKWRARDRGAGGVNSQLYSGLLS